MSISANYPEELLWNGRSLDPDFDPEEYLYIRVQYVDEYGRFTNLDVKGPDTSFNRAKYSKPAHVLYARYPMFLEWHVGGLQVKEIPGPLYSGDKRKFDFQVEHVPVRPPEEENENYSHSEVRSYVAAVRQKKLPSKVGKEYRELMARLIQPIAFEKPISSASTHDQNM